MMMALLMFVQKVAAAEEAKVQVDHAHEAALARSADDAGALRSKSKHKK